MIIPLAQPLLCGAVGQGAVASRRPVSSVVGLLLCLCATSAFAAPKACDELKAEIEAKIQAQGVTSYTLEIVSDAEARDQDPSMIVGSCEYGSKKIVYQKNDR